MARGRKLIQEIVSDPDLPATSREFRGSIARPRDTLTALRLLRICTYSGARSTAPYHRGTHVCTYTRAPFACTRVRNLICTFGRLHVAAAAFCFSLSSSPPPPPTSSLAHFRSTFGPSSRTPVYRQLVRPCGRTGESDKRQGRPGPRGSYKIRNSSKTMRASSGHVPELVFDRSNTRLKPCARFIKIKD